MNFEKGQNVSSLRQHNGKYYWGLLKYLHLTGESNSNDTVEFEGWTFIDQDEVLRESLKLICHAKPCRERPAPRSAICQCVSTWKIKLDFLCKVIWVMLRESSQPKTAMTSRVTSASLDFTSDNVFDFILFLVNAVEKTRPEMPGVWHWTSRYQWGSWSALKNTVFWSLDKYMWNRLVYTFWLSLWNICYHMCTGYVLLLQN